MKSKFLCLLLGVMLFSGCVRLYNAPVSSAGNRVATLKEDYRHPAFRILGINGERFGYEGYYFSTEYKELGRSLSAIMISPFILLKVAIPTPRKTNLNPGANTLEIYVEGLEPVEIAFTAEHNANYKIFYDREKLEVEGDNYFYYYNSVVIKDDAGRTVAKIPSSEYEKEKYKSKFIDLSGYYRKDKS